MFTIEQASAAPARGGKILLKLFIKNGALIDNSHFDPLVMVLPHNGNCSCIVSWVCLQLFQLAYTNSPPRNKPCRLVIIHMYIVTILCRHSYIVWNVRLCMKLLYIYFYILLFICFYFFIFIFIANLHFGNLS